jgi:lipopolysaccharide transport system permease protein
MILNLWFYVTPIIYPASAIPSQFAFFANWLNPMTAISEVYRDLVLEGKIVHGQQWALASLVSVVVFLLGFWVYKKLRPAFADVL